MTFSITSRTEKTLRIQEYTVVLRNSFGSKFEKFQAFSAIFRMYSKQLAINSTLSHLYIFLFGSMLQLFAEVMQEAVYNLCGETNAHDSLHCSKYCKLCSTLWILQNKLLTLASLVLL